MSKLADHFFVSDCDGALHDTRIENWGAEPLRRVYRRTFAEISTTSELLATLRAGCFTFPGAYPLFLITSDGAALDFQCARDNLAPILESIKSGANDGWRVVGCAVNWESDITCDHCGEPIESAYGCADE